MTLQRVESRDTLGCFAYDYSDFMFKNTISPLIKLRSHIHDKKINLENSRRDWKVEKFGIRWRQRIMNPVHFIYSGWFHALGLGKLHAPVVA